MVSTAMLGKRLWRAGDSSQGSMAAADYKKIYKLSTFFLRIWPKIDQNDEIEFI